MVRVLLENGDGFAAANRALVGRSSRLGTSPAIISVWQVEVQGPNGYFRQAVVPLAMDPNGRRIPMPESSLNQLREIEVAMTGVIDTDERFRLVNTVLPEMLRRDIDHRGLLRDDSSLASRLIAWIEII